MVVGPSSALSGLMCRMRSVVSRRLVQHTAVAGTCMTLCSHHAVRMDPFCVLRLGNKEAKTHTAWGECACLRATRPWHTHSNDAWHPTAPTRCRSSCVVGGRNPNWHQLLRLDVHPGMSELHVSVRMLCCLADPVHAYPSAAGVTPLECCPDSCMLRCCRQTLSFPACVGTQMLYLW